MYLGGKPLHKVRAIRRFLKFKMMSEICFEMYYLSSFSLLLIDRYRYRYIDRDRYIHTYTKKALHTLKQPLVTVFENASTIIANQCANGYF